MFLNDLDPDAVRVELYAEGVNGGNPLRQEMRRVGQAAGTSGVTVYHESNLVDRGASLYRV